MNTKVKVVIGDIAKISADALIAPINSGGVWCGAIDDVIRESAGNQFHKQAREAVPLKDGQTVIARAQSAYLKGESFGDVVFVIDDLLRPLREVVTAGLKAADAAGYKSVTVPTMRLGVMLGTVEKTAAQAINELAIGATAFLAGNPKAVKLITFVVYRDSETKAALDAALGLN